MKMKCTNCGREGQTLTIYVNASSMKTNYICVTCQAVAMAKSIHNIQELDDLIKDYERMGANMEDMIKNHPADMPEVPKGLEGLAQTPVTAYKDILLTLAELKSRRVELLIQKGGEAMLEYELKKAVETEDFEKSALLRDKLKKLRKKK